MQPADAHDHWLHEVFSKNSFRKETPLRPSAKYLQNEFTRALKKHGAPEVSGGALSRIRNLAARVQSNLVAAKAPLVARSETHDHIRLYHVVYVQVCDARAGGTFDVRYTETSEDPAHADLTMDVELVTSLGQAQGTNPKTEIEPFRRLASVFLACEGADLSSIEALRSE